MNRHLKAIGMAVLASSMGLQVAAQDIHFSQFYENNIMRNPALTGIFSGDYKVGVDYRTQWSDISVPFQTTLITGETRVALNKDVGDYLSFGVAATYDHAGSISFNSMQVYPAISLNKALEDKHGSYLSVGFTGGYIDRTVDQTKMTFTSQYINGNYSSTNPSGENINFANIRDFDLGTGIALNSSVGAANRFNYYLGASLFHVAQPKESFYKNDDFIRLTMKWQGNLGFKYAINRQWALTVHANYTNQVPYQEWIMGGLISYRNVPGDLDPKHFTISGGAFVRVNDAIIPTFQLGYQNLAVTLSYDYNNSQLKPASTGYGGFEISLFMRGNFNHGNSEVAKTKCPQFEDMPNAAFHD